MTDYPLINTFKNTKKVKITRYIIILIVATIISSLIDTHFTIEKTPIPNLENSTDKIKPLIIIGILLLIASIFKIGFTILSYFVFFYIVSKIFNQYTEKSYIFNAVLILITISYSINAIILIIQYIMGINNSDFYIGSLNIFDPGNTLLESLNIVLIIKTYLIFLISKHTIRLNNKKAFFIILMYLFIIIGFQIFRYTL